ncbi:MAG: 6,7-dimethyl-8-ribityllumazine synthase [Bacteriovoracia bacterium]
MKFAILKSKFNPEVTNGLLDGAKVYLTEQGIKEIDVFDAPGAFELPLLAQELAKTKKYDGIICLGAVIKGETAHFEFISLGTSYGIMQAMLSTGTPISFGVLTTYNDEQAQARSKPNQENKGIEAASACYELACTLREIHK